MCVECFQPVFGLRGRLSPWRLREKESVLLSRLVQVTTDVAKLLGEQKVDAIFCVAGGWAGGSCSSKGQSSTFLFAVTLIISCVSPAAKSRAKYII